MEQNATSLALPQSIGLPCSSKVSRGKKGSSFFVKIRENLKQ